jgi:hypothetical protein
LEQAHALELQQMKHEQLQLLHEHEQLLAALADKERSVRAEAGCKGCCLPASVPLSSTRALPCPHARTGGGCGGADLSGQAGSGRGRRALPAAGGCAASDGREGCRVRGGRTPCQPSDRGPAAAAG